MARPGRRYRVWCGGGTQHGRFHRGNQGPRLEKAKQIFPDKNRSRETHPFHHRVFYICCDLLLFSSAHNPPVQPLPFPAGFLVCKVLQPCRTGSPQPCRTGSPHRLTAALPHRLTAGRLRSPRTSGVQRQAERLRRGRGRQSFVPASRGRDAPFLGRLFASDPSAPRRGIYKATFSPPLFRCVWKFSTSTAIRFGG